MALTFGEAFDEVCETQYGVKVESTVPYLSGEYNDIQPSSRKPSHMLDVIWDLQGHRGIAGLTRKLILPHVVELYTQENDIDLRLVDGRVIGDVTFVSHSLSCEGMLSVLEPRLHLRPFKPESLPWEESS